MAHVWEFIRHLDAHLYQWVADYGTWTYGLLFAIIFAETGLVFAPFLPGDTLLFTAGIISSPGGVTRSVPGLNIWLTLLVLTVAPIAGDNVNYFFGKWLGPRLFHNPKSRIFKHQNLDRTHEFFEKYGPKTVILARWVPIVRTFAPFVAGMGAMPYRKFLGYSIVGAAIWVWTLVGAGYLLGKNEWVSAHFPWVMLTMMLITGGPVVVEVLKKRAQGMRLKREAVMASRRSDAP
jgi:membrane-associated protein